MLLKSIVDFLLSIVDWIFGLLPDLKLPFSTSRMDFVSPIMNFWGYIDSFISMDILVACVAVVLVIDNISLITRLIRFILNKFGLG